jgi:hypothetical protein
VPPLERWLGSLDPRELRGKTCVRRFSFDDWIVDVDAIALAAEAARPCGCAQLVPHGARGGRVNDVRPLRRKIKKKAARYGELDQPYLLAVLALGDAVVERDVEHALLGASHRDHAVWHGPGGPCNTRLSGVLVARGLRSTDPFATAAALPTLWRNPWALRPLGLALPWRDVVAAVAQPAAA